MFSPEMFLQNLGQYVYEPWLVYSLIIAFLVASSFGFPVPEEVTIISAGILGYLALNPQLYPPPHPGAAAVHPKVLAIVCFFSVFLSDLLVFLIGRYGRYRLEASRRFRPMLSSTVFRRVELLVHKYGAIMAGVFRFTPGLRFPGHLACGMLGLPQWKFWAVDGTAALLSVPTQVLLVAYYGEEILAALKQAKLVLLGVGVVGIVTYLIWRRRFERAPIKPESPQSPL